jgi:hypothetical protein
MGEATDAVDALFERLRPYIRILVDHGEVREIIADTIRQAEAAAYERAAQTIEAMDGARGIHGSRLLPTREQYAAAIRRLAEQHAKRAMD